MVGWVVQRRKALGQNLDKYIRPLPGGKVAKCGDGSSRIILYLNLRFLTGLMQWAQGWASPASPIDKSKFTRWETESSRRVRLMLSWYFSEGHSDVFRGLYEKKTKPLSRKNDQSPVNPRSPSENNLVGAEKDMDVVFV